MRKVRDDASVCGARSANREVIPGPLLSVRRECFRGWRACREPDVVPTGVRMPRENLQAAITALKARVKTIRDSL